MGGVENQVLQPADISRKIRERASAEGFEKVGIVRAEALNLERERLHEWLHRGFQGEMQWMEREPLKRTDPRLFLASARLVIVVALNYYTPHEHTDDPATGKISRYS